MAKGLEKNSPIVLKLTKENYDALIERHGQWVRWLSARKCTCVTETGRVDYNCQRCGGDGWIYTHQLRKSVYDAKCKVLSDSWVELPCQAVYVDRIKGAKEYQILNLLDGKFVQINGNLEKNELVFADYVESLMKKEKARCVYEGNNRFFIQSRYAKKIRERELQPDVVQVNEIKNRTNGERYSVQRVYRSIIEIRTPVFPVAETDFVEADIEVVEPKLFLLLNQNFAEIDQRFLTETGGSGILVFPSEYSVAEGDVVVALSAEMVGKIVVTKGVSQEDKLPVWYVSKIENVASSSGDINPSLYQLKSYNRIVWANNPHVPAPGDTLSITIRYNPVYRVLQEMPVVRSSENQQIARRVAVKFLNMGGAEVEGI